MLKGQQVNYVPLPIPLFLLSLRLIYHQSLLFPQFLNENFLMTKDTSSILDIGSLPRPGPRFSLRKRSIRKDSDMVNLSSYNSDFLSGLFADVAKVNVLSELNIPQKRGYEQIDSALTGSAICRKKSRKSLNRCLSRVDASSTNLAQISQVQSPKGINEFFRASRKDLVSHARKSLAQSNHNESLAFQLNCVSGDDCISAATNSNIQSTSVGDAARVAFPNLPTTISDSSCDAGLTRAQLVRPVSTPENDTKESFGWFVDLDDHQSTPDLEAPPCLHHAVSCDDLAFQAPTAPKRVNDDAEVEWAKAADTVDDVLGGFF